MNTPIDKARALHDRLGSIIDQVGQPDYSLREMVAGLREVRDELLTLSSDGEREAGLNAVLDTLEESGTLKPYPPSMDDPRPEGTSREPSEETLREHAELLANKSLLAKREIEWRASVLAKAWLARSAIGATDTRIARVRELMIGWRDNRHEHEAMLRDIEEVVYHAAPSSVARSEPCKHQGNRSTHYDHTSCGECGAVFTDNGWGIARQMWFKDLEDARFYKQNGRLPEARSAMGNHVGGKGE